MASPGDEVDIYRFSEGTAPLLVSVPHDGRHVPDAIAARMTEAARCIPDTDWHVCRLYDFAAGLGASVLEATHSRYVADVNRDPEGAVLYPDADNTELCPVKTFDLEPIYLPGEDPDDAEVADRIATYWQPYHDRIAAELARLRERFGFVILFDAHSIRSEVPRFFDGVIPDFNLGTASGVSADAELTRRAFAVLDGAKDFTAVLNGRFTGGYITRHYGDPARSVHTIQLEQSQATYMNEAWPFEYREDLAGRVKPVLRRLIEEIIAWARTA